MNTDLSGWILRYSSITSMVLYSALWCLIADNQAPSSTTKHNMELAVRPLQLGRPDVADEYEVLVANFPHLTITDIERPTVRRAAELRARHGLRPADALQVAA